MRSELIYAGDISYDFREVVSNPTYLESVAKYKQSLGYTNFDDAVVGIKAVRKTYISFGGSLKFVPVFDDILTVMRLCNLFKVKELIFISAVNRIESDIEYELCLINLDAVSGSGNDKLIEAVTDFENSLGDSAECIVLIPASDTVKIKPVSYDGRYTIVDFDNLKCSTCGAKLSNILIKRQLITNCNNYGYVCSNQRCGDMLYLNILQYFGIVCHLPMYTPIYHALVKLKLVENIKDVYLTILDSDNEHGRIIFERLADDGIPYAMLEAFRADLELTYGRVRLSDLIEYLVAGIPHLKFDRIGTLPTMKRSTRYICPMTIEEDFDDSAVLFAGELVMLCEDVDNLNDEEFRIRMDGFEKYMSEILFWSIFESGRQIEFYDLVYELVEIGVLT